MATPINLNRFRKRRAREEKARRAEENRIKHGLSGAAKAQQRAQQKKADEELAGKKLKPPDDGRPDRDEPSD